MGIIAFFDCNTVVNSVTGDNGIGPLTGLNHLRGGPQACAVKPNEPLRALRAALHEGVDGDLCVAGYEEGEDTTAYVLRTRFGFTAQDATMTLRTMRLLRRRTGGKTVPAGRVEDVIEINRADGEVHRGSALEYVQAQLLEHAPELLQVPAGQREEPVTREDRRWIAAAVLAWTRKGEADTVVWVTDDRWAKAAVAVLARHLPGLVAMTTRDFANAASRKTEVARFARFAA